MAHFVVIGSLAESLINFRGTLLRQAVAGGHRVTAVAPDAPETVREALDKMGVAYADIPIDRTGLNPWRDLGTFFHLWRFFRRVRPDVVLSYTIKPVLYGSLAARAAGVRSIYVMVTGLGYVFGEEAGRQSFFHHVMFGAIRLALSGTRKVFFQNVDDRDVFVARRLLPGAAHAVLINGSGVDIDHYSPSALPARPVFLLIARLLKGKGVAEYAGAARRVRACHPEAIFRLVGWLDNNPQSIAPADLQRWIDSGVIEYLGKLDDVRPAIAECSVFVLPATQREGLPRTVLEAMAMGRPVVTTTVPGCRATIFGGRPSDIAGVQEGENGFLVPPGDIQRLAAVLERLSIQPSLAATMGAAGRSLAEKHFDARKVSDVLLSTMGLL